jgi:hypothetical protein
MEARATLALKPGVWFRRGRLLIVSPDSLGTACPLSDRNSTYRLVQILEAGSKAVSVGDRDVTVSSSIMTAVNDAGSGLLHNMPGRCNFMTQTNKVAKTIETRGFCNYADRAGDQVFEEFATDGPVTLGSPILFKGKWLGGTGKFEGLSGEFEIRPASVLVSDTLVQGAGKKTGTYQIKKTPVAQK